jgi:hypothetical protein
MSQALQMQLQKLPEKLALSETPDVVPDSADAISELSETMPELLEIQVISGV